MFYLKFSLRIPLKAIMRLETYLGASILLQLLVANGLGSMYVVEIKFTCKYVYYKLVLLIWSNTQKRDV